MYCIVFVFGLFLEQHRTNGDCLRLWGALLYYEMGLSSG